MLTATAASAAIASDATSSGLGSDLDSGLGSGSQSKKSRNYSCSYCKPIVFFVFLPNSYPHAKFHPYQTKNGQKDSLLVSQKIAVLVSN